MRVVTRYVLLVSAVVFLLYCGQVSGGGDDSPRNPRIETPTTDNYDGDGEKTAALYESTRDLLLYKIDTWLNGYFRKLKSISKYLGFNQETRNLLDFAMTELMHVERAGKINIPHLVELFFYACDVETMCANESDGLDAVTERFKVILTQFGYTKHDWKGHDLKYFQQELLKKAHAVERQSRNKFTVSVPLMKNRAFTDSKAANPTVNKIRLRFIKDYGENKAIYEKQTDGKAVTAYHLTILGKIIQDAFAFIHDHVTILSEMLLRIPNTSDAIGLTTVSEHFCKFVPNYIDLLVDRYFEMKTGMDDEYETSFLKWRTDLTKLEYKLDPHVKPWDDIQNYTEGLKKDVQDMLVAMLKLFGSESVEEWKKNRTIKAEYRADIDILDLFKLLQVSDSEAHDFSEFIVAQHLDPIPKL